MKTARKTFGRAKETFRVIAIDETEHWDAALLAKHHIAKAFCLYLFREGEGTHCCSMSPSSWCVALSNEFIFDFDLDPSLRPAVIDQNIYLSQNWQSYSCDVLELIREIPGNKGLSSEALDDCYFDFIRVSNTDARRISEPVTFTFRASDYKGGSKGEEYRDAVWETAREWFSGNAMHPAILDPATYLAYEVDQVAKLRAKNEPPLSLGFPQLPLFVAASKRLPERLVVAAKGWVSNYVRHWYERHPEDFARADEMKGLA